MVPTTVTFIFVYFLIIKLLNCKGIKLKQIAKVLITQLTQKFRSIFILYVQALSMELGNLYFDKIHDTIKQKKAPS
jgi:hypothetical protein